MFQITSNSNKKNKKKSIKQQKFQYQCPNCFSDRQSDKQNYPDNIQHHKKSPYKHNIQLTKTILIKSNDKAKNYFYQTLDRQRLSKINLINHPIPPFQNLKLLKKSIIKQNFIDIRSTSLNCSREKHHPNIEFSQKLESAKINKTRPNQNSKQLISKVTENLEEKVQKYVQFVNQVLSEMSLKVLSQYKNQASHKKYLLYTTGQQILKEIAQKMDKKIVKTISKSIQVSNFCSYPSKTGSRQLQKQMNSKEGIEENEFKKIIGELQEQNSKLTQMISKQERKNIKMLIELNQTESKQIQKCKKYLSILYKKYKILQRSILRQNNKFKSACQKSREIQKKNIELTNKNREFFSELQRMKSILQQKKSILQQKKSILQQNQNISKITLQEQQQNRISHFNPNDKKLIPKTQINHFNIQFNNTTNLHKDFVTKRAMSSSCLSPRHSKNLKQKYQNLSSSPTANKILNKHIKQQSNRINFKSDQNKNQSQISPKNLQNIQQNTNNQLKRQILTLRSKFYYSSELKTSIQNQINELQQKLLKKDQKISRMQAIINQQLQEIEKLMKLNGNLQKQLRISQRLSENGKSTSEQKKLTTDREQKKQKIDKLRQKEDFVPILNRKVIQTINGEDQYRIIAMQASILEKFINYF